MKKLLLILISVTTISGYPQTLMLNCRKAVVKAEMHYYPEYERTVSCRNYIEYQKDSVAIGFRFFEDTARNYFGRWICNEVLITMPLSHEIPFIEKKTGCDCWCPISPDVWRYRTDAFAEMVLVRRYYSGDMVTFVYGW